MPPARSNPETAPRRLPFKAPSRVGERIGTTTKSKGKAPANSATRSKPTNKKQSANSTILISDEDEVSNDDFNSDIEADVRPAKRRQTTTRLDEPATPRRHSTTALAAAEDNPIALLEDDLDEITIPRPLLARILHQGFEDKNMKIGKEPMGIMELYTKLFVKEALARSKQEAMAKDGADSGDTRWLQVEDLEKIAPQLMLDF